MGRNRLRAGVIGVCVLLVLGQCTRKQPQTKIPAAQPAPRPAPETEPVSKTPQTSPAPTAEEAPQSPPAQPELASQQEPQELSDEARIEALVEQANAAFDLGQERFESGDEAAARAYFRQALDLLKHAGLDFASHPSLEQAYYDLLGEVQRMESHAALDVSQLPVPEIEPSPLDEIADVNLFQIDVDPALEELVSEDLKETRFEIPVTLNREVLKFLDYYQGRGREIMSKGLRRSGRYMRLFREVFDQEQVPRDLIYMAHVESLFQPQALSRARAKGIWQFVVGTGKKYGLDVDWWVDERSDVLKSTQAAARHLKDLYAEFSDWNLALAAYNAGAGRITRVLDRHGQMDYWTMAERRLLPRETRNYVPSILAAIIIFRHPERYGFQVEYDPEIDFETIQLDFQIDLRVLADSLDIPAAEIAELNPELRRAVTPDQPGFELRVPLGTADPLREQLKEIPPEKRLRVAHHSVSRGETLSQIARRYGVSIQAIAEANRLRNVNRLSLGQDLLIPLSDWKASAKRLAAAAPSSKRPASRASSYTVRRGDSLYRIARTHGLRVKDLAAWNNLRPGQTIYPGQKLRLSPRRSVQALAGGSSRD